MAIAGIRVFLPTDKKYVRNSASIKRLGDIVCWTERGPGPARKETAYLCYAREGEGFSLHRAFIGECAIGEPVSLPASLGAAILDIYVSASASRQFLVLFEGMGAIIPIRAPWAGVENKLVFPLARIPRGVLISVKDFDDEGKDRDFYVVGLDGSVSPVVLSGAPDIRYSEISLGFYFSYGKSASGERQYCVGRQRFEDRSNEIVVHQDEPVIIREEPYWSDSQSSIWNFIEPEGGGICSPTTVWLVRSGDDNPVVVRADEVARSLGMPEGSVRFWWATTRYQVLCTAASELGVYSDGQAAWSRRLSRFVYGGKAVSVASLEQLMELRGACDELLFFERPMYELQVYSLRTRKLMHHDVARSLLSRPQRWRGGYLLKDHEHNFVWFDGPSLRGDHMQKTERELLNASLGADTSNMLQSLGAAAPGQVPEGLAAAIARWGHQPLLEALVDACWNGIAEEDFWIESTLAAVIDTAVASRIEVPKAMLVRLMEECCYDVIVVAALKAYGVFYGTPAAKVAKLVLARWRGNNPVYNALPDAAKFV